MKKKGKLYFVGAGGIGMANLVRYYLRHGARVAGYDRTPSILTHNLEKEGAILTYTDSEEEIPEEFRDAADTLVVYTPAVPKENKILHYFRSHGFEVVKRAALLGKITRHTDSICVAGSHGKTTTSSMIANIMRNSEAGCTAFLGGILRNVDSNLVLNEKSDVTVIEADEYDRSFHQLTPHIAVITSTDPDHLDIYGDEAHYLEAFSIYSSLIRPGGKLLLHTGLKMKPAVGEDVTVETYSGQAEGDWHAEDIKIGNGTISFTLVTPRGKRIENLSPGVPVEINIDNAVAAAAAALSAGATEEDVRKGLAEFKGAKRRFEVRLNGSERPGGPVLIDDYAHSPNEIRASIQSVRKLYPGKKLSVIFQPHLYTRTRDFAGEFAEALSHADEVIMPEIYPAREEPIEGITSETILRDVKSREKSYCERKDLLNKIKNSNFEILMTLGAADIDTLLPEMEAILANRL
ncbi:MAG: UDP-N-acetylmuramate--L-alanine ligase [Candidatus Amulumruptor caecigallinarius]|nr:UDP-N-acetylmuramate--L-alanine ligase [Candidatus Amulumruptor caecigallinarius]